MSQQFDLHKIVYFQINVLQSRKRFEILDVVRTAQRTSSFSSIQFIHFQTVKAWMELLLLNRFLVVINTTHCWLNACLPSLDVLPLTFLPFRCWHTCMHSIRSSTKGLIYSKKLNHRCGLSESRLVHFLFSISILL